MNDRDAFGRGQEAAEELRRAVEALRDDARAVVREEVEEAGIPESELRGLVADMVREELARDRRARRDPAPSGLLLAVGLGVGVLAGGLGVWFLASPPGSGADAESEPPKVASEPANVSSPPEGPEGVEGAVEGGEPREASPGDRAARYDSLFRAVAPELESLGSDLDGADAPVREALSAWRAGEALDPAADRRLHDGFVQAALNRLAGAGLALDGRVTRDPCGGASCGVLLRLWAERGSEWDLPPYPEEAAAREAELPVVERLLVLAAVEASDG